MQPLQGFRPLGHDQAAGARFADESHGLDGLVFGEGDACPLADALNGIQHSRRQAGFVTRLGQQRGRERAPFGRFVNDGAACRKGWGDLPRRQHEGRIPRRDGAYRTDGLANRVVHVLRGRQGQSVPCARRTVCEEAEILRAAFGRGGHETDRLAGIHGFHDRDLFGLCLDGIGDVMEQRTALCTCHRPPVCECPGCGLGCATHIVSVARSHRAEKAVVHGRVVVERLPG